ncbi:MAG: lysophospholipid acyltransferase family protein [Patescibacteria group bacterium]
MIKTFLPVFLQNSIWLPTRIFLKFFTRFEIRGFEHIKNLSGPLIFASNHASELDPILVTAAMPFFSPLLPIFYVAKKGEFYKKDGPLGLIYGGVFFKLWGAYPVREGLKNYKLSLNIHLEMLKEKKCLLIFPEGKITKDGNIGSAHGGIGYLAYATKSKVVPVAIQGNFHLTQKDFFSRKRKIIITIGAPINPSSLFAGVEEPSVEECQSAAKKIMSHVKKLIK